MGTQEHVWGNRADGPAPRRQGRRAVLAAAMALALGAGGCGTDAAPSTDAGRSDTQASSARTSTSSAASSTTESSSAASSTAASSTRTTHQPPVSSPPPPPAARANAAGASGAGGAEADAESGASPAITDAGTGQGWEPAQPLPANFTVTSADPTLDELNAIIHFLVATSASDEAKARNLEAGEKAVIVPQTVYRMGLFRAPNGWKRLSGPVHGGDGVRTASLEASSVGRPTVHVNVTFVFTGGNWRLADSSVCEGVRAVGLPLHCNA